MGRISIAKLKDNMLELASEPQEIKDLPIKGLKEGPFMFDRKGIYYMTYPHVENNIERLEYAMSDNPMGPYKFAGVIMDESPTGCWTNHQSIVKFKEQWYLFYHQNDLSPKFDKNRSVCIDSLFFNVDGTIRKVKPTLRGVGITKATDKIQFDRYSRISDKGICIEFNDTLNYFGGWKTVFKEEDAWVQYNSVDFSVQNYKWINVRSLSEKGGILRLSLDNVNEPASAKIKIPAGIGWKTVRVKISGIKTGVHNLILVNDGDKAVEVDWVKFE